MHQNQYKKMLNLQVKCGNIDGCMNKFMEEALKDMKAEKEKSTMRLFTLFEEHLKKAIEITAEGIIFILTTPTM